MDIQLHGWLEGTVQEQLLLGNSWLRDKNSRKEAGVKTQFDKTWDTLYHDNGSCLDIINSIHPERNSALQILQTNPLTLTDGYFQVVAHLTPDCVRTLPPRLLDGLHALLHTVIAVRKYTLRHTLYGPPRDKVRFILHEIDYLGVNKGKTRTADSEPLGSLHGSEPIGAVLEQLHHTRAQEDLRCLRSSTEPAVDEDAIAGAMDESESAPHTQLPQTQFAFATQLQPIRARNTQRREILPNAANEDEETRMKLLRLIGNPAAKSTDNPSPNSDTGLVRPTSNKQRSVVGPSTAATPPRSLVLADQQSTRAGAEEGKANTASPTLTRGKNRVRHARPASPAIVQQVGELSDMRQYAEQDSRDDAATPGLECAWMKGFIFDREALRVPLTQQVVLQKPTSWHKPQPGCPGVTAGNIPITILETLSRIADEKATVEGLSDSDSEADFDPSPEDVPEEVDASRGAMPNLTQDDEPTTSQVSWSPSPSPEPPQKPVKAHQGLPPDSSFENKGLNTNEDGDRQQTVPRLQSQRPLTIDPPHENEPSPPSSSPPIVVQPADSDEEMEMETSVPQGLGEDALQASRPQNIGTHQGPALPPIVQVKETPYAKGKNGQTLRFADSPPKQKQDSSGNSKQSSSGSIVYATYKDPSSSASLEGANSRNLATSDMSSRPQDARAAETQRKAPIEKEAPSQPDRVVPQDVPMLDAPSNVEPPPKIMEKATLPSRPAPPAVLAQAPTTSRSPPSHRQPRAEANLQKQPLLTSGVTNPGLPKSAPTKRKLGDSPTKSSKRNSKRREIKIVSFGDSAPSTVNHTTTSHEERAESLQKSREEKHSSTSFESRPGPVCEQQDADAMEVDLLGVQTSNASSPAISPRHRSLYEDPSPTKPSSTKPSTDIATSWLPPSTIPSDVQPEVVPVRSRAASVVEMGAQESPAAINNAEPRTVFEAFKAAYPEYTGGAKPFEKLCRSMYELDLQDKMVPKWQWDDFIMRNRTDYKDYLAECADQSEDPEPYHRFYKDAIRDTLFKAGIIESRETLLKALEELGVQAPAPRSSKQSAKSPPKDKRSRASLPGTFNLHKKPIQDRINGTARNRPRHSLPTGSHTNRQSPSRTTPVQKIRSPPRSTSHRDVPSNRPKPKSSPLQRLTSDQVQSPRDTTEDSGDPFRDYFFAVQRSTSWTGSTKVDKSKAWPQSLAVRPSIADAPKKKVDVLGWRDML
ncbi:uncharacterized protein K460DRAFT_345032 [Cucurbitaria berberidis CBS 394.84]|uniref:Telomere replication protein EST3 n=1 Tax=Cucurbitaria berberidis CBS 394.84 TaxID=1168544 RepID=A0A9P4GA46_9PLEO|nr:uncharacterized protein K460DRAFT_345032 [Cucurbitaria berberidis CBS 394.84]KAF1841815.1 hypothetical protein K460DRAFT_345032 [Cucurbitaria berberidis CBS 394.84]